MSFIYSFLFFSCQFIFFLFLKSLFSTKENESNAYKYNINIATNMIILKFIFLAFLTILLALHKEKQLVTLYSHHKSCARFGPVVKIDNNQDSELLVIHGLLQILSPRPSLKCLVGLQRLKLPIIWQKFCSLHSTLKFQVRDYKHSTSSTVVKCRRRFGLTHRFLGLKMASKD